MSSSSNATAASSASTSSPYQGQLIAFCRENKVRAPTWQIVSDRRGGRTAWSSTVAIQGQHIPARFWYDGQFVNNAKEDAAEKALQLLGQLPLPTGPQPAHLQQQQHQQQHHQQEQRQQYQQQYLQEHQQSAQMHGQQQQQSYQDQQSQSRYYGSPTS